MADILKISPQRQIRVPKKLMEKIGLYEGDYVEIALRGMEIVLKPRKLIDPQQGWFWTKEWQEGEKEVDKEIQIEELSPEFHTAEEGLEWLKG